MRVTGREKEKETERETETKKESKKCISIINSPVVPPVCFECKGGRMGHGPGKPLSAPGQAGLGLGLGEAD